MPVRSNFPITQPRRLETDSPEETIYLIRRQDTHYRYADCASLTSFPIEPCGALRLSCCGCITHASVLTTADSPLHSDTACVNLVLLFRSRLKKVLPYLNHHTDRPSARLVVRYPLFATLCIPAAWMLSIRPILARCKSYTCSFSGA